MSPAAPAPIPADRRQTLLLVDDTPQNLIALEALLHQPDRELLMASSGEEALNLLLEHDVAIALVDVQMPGMDGFELAQLMRGSSRTRHIPILFITAFMRDEKSMLRGYDAGAIDFLSKPVDSHILKSKVALFLELDLARRQLNQTNNQLDEALAYNEAILAAAAEGIIVTDPDGRLTYANQAACRMLKGSNDRLQGRPLNELILPPDSNIIPWEASAFHDTLRRGSVYRNHESQLYALDGTTLPAAVSCAPLPAPRAGLVVIFQDMSVPQRLQAELERQLVTDLLTGLYNRDGFMQTLESVLARAAREHRRFAVLYLDLDGFKRINDTLGHAAGDELLRSVALRLRACVRPYDAISRLGGDEFCLILDGIDDEQDVARVAEKILDLMGAPHHIGGRQVNVGGSVGIATYPECAHETGKLVQAADMAMYQAKSEGRNKYRFFTDEMNFRAQARMMLEESLRTAVNESEFILHYQPQIRLADGSLRGFEALIRWDHSSAGLVQPGIFIPLLEGAGLIHQIGEWVLAEACAQTLRWIERLPQGATVAVNLSPRQFTNRHLLDGIRKLIEANGVDPARIELEVTEGSLIQDMDYTCQVLRELRAIGIKIAVDDFGTGYSSLAYLRKFELDALKIDREFISSLLNSDKDAAITHSIIQLGHNLGLEIIAEGVETEAQAQYLRQLKCDTVQGFLYGRPLPATQIHEIFR